MLSGVVLVNSSYLLHYLLLKSKQEFIFQGLQINLYGELNFPWVVLNQFEKREAEFSLVRPRPISSHRGFFPLFCLSIY